MKPKEAALVIIDMQCGMVEPAAGRRNNPQAENNIAALLSAWRTAGAPVVHVKHLSKTPASPFWPDKSSAEFQSRFMPAEDEYVVEKNVPDAFINTGLKDWLDMRGVERLVISGVSTNISVESTARTAGNLGFTVVIAMDATFAFDREDCRGVPRTGEEVHAMSLANLNGEFATLAKTAALLAAV